MIALIWFVLAVPTSPFKSKSRLEAENAVLRHQGEQSSSAYQQRPLVPGADVSMVSIDPEGQQPAKSGYCGAPRYSWT
jgi:hypothetical protein